MSHKGMWLQRLIYFLREAFRNLRTSPLVSAVSTAIIALSIFIFGLFLVIFVNFAGMFQRWNRNVAVDVYLAPGIDSKSTEALAAKFKGMPEITDIQFISADKAYEQFRKMLGPQAELLDELGKNPLPASFRLTPIEKVRNTDALALLAQKLENLPGVAEVRYGAKWVERFQAIIQVLRMLGIVIGLILLLASVLIISNTIRLTVYSRKEEIEIMRLVGATETFIRIPFFLEGLFQGLVAGLAAVGILWVIYMLFLANINLPFGAFGIGQFVFLPSWAIVSLVSGGALLGMVGSSVALSRFMK